MSGFNKTTAKLCKIQIEWMIGTKVPVLVVGVEMFPIIAEWGLIQEGEFEINFAII